QPGRRWRPQTTKQGRGGKTVSCGRLLYVEKPRAVAIGVDTARGVKHRSKMRLLALAPVDHLQGALGGLAKIAFVFFILVGSLGDVESLAQGRHRFLAIGTEVTQGRGRCTADAVVLVVLQ